MNFFASRHFFLKITASVALTAFVFPFPLQADTSGSYLHYSAPQLLTFQELGQLSKNPSPPAEINRKLKALFTTPFISNEAYQEGARPKRPSNQKLGTFLRAMTWNIEKSYGVPDAITAFTDPEGFVQLIDFDAISIYSKDYQRAVKQRDLLDDVDLLILQEMDLGVKRSGYRDNARELAKALHMNYAYAAQYLEIDPFYLGLETMFYEGGTEDVEAEKYYRADPERYKGLFGSAVLSRYPIQAAWTVPLKTQGYDWYTEEKKKPKFIERLRRIGAQTIFRTEVHREMKIGGRSFFRVDLRVPDLPEETLTVINIHLEIKCLPKVREKQIEEILSYIRDIHHPVIMAGDFNSAPSDISPTSVSRIAKRTAGSPTAWFALLVRYAVSSAAAGVNVTRFISNMTKNYQNPPARHIPILMPNPIAGMFKKIKKFRFDDGGAFDFRGDRRHAYHGKGGLLADSNQRDFWKFKTTFKLKRTVAHLIGKYRLDWFFVKSFLKDPFNKKGPYRFAPHFGRTLTELNRILKVPISDHDPSIIDLPFHEPPLR